MFYSVPLENRLSITTSINSCFLMGQIEIYGVIMLFFLSVSCNVNFCRSSSGVSRWLLFCARAEGEARFFIAANFLPELHDKTIVTNNHTPSPRGQLTLWETAGRLCLHN